MKFSEYIKGVKRSESPNFGPLNVRILHGVIGCCTESGELLDAIKKSAFYNRELDRTNIEEELGDLLWYIALIIDECDFDFETILEKNIRKLRVRYPEQFSDERAANRDLNKEIEAFETEEEDNCEYCHGMGCEFCL